MAPSKPNLQVLSGGKAEDPRAALKEMYERYFGDVYGRCVFLLKDRTKAEDAMQEVFTRALAHWGEFRVQASPLTWLMKIATHHCLNLMRSQRAGWWRAYLRQEAGKPVGHGGLEIHEQRDAVRRVLSKVDPETQAAAIHYHVDEMTLEEVASLLGRSVPTVRKRLEHFARVSEEELKS